MSRRTGYALVTASAIVLLVLAYPFFVGALCITAASHRWHLVSAVHLCPPFVETLPSEIAERFNTVVAPNASRKAVEAALSDLEVAYSWDEYQGRYQGVVRTPGSNFHALVIHVYMNQSETYERIEVNDSFTSL